MTAAFHHSATILRLFDYAGNGVCEDSVARRGNGAGARNLSMADRAESEDEAFPPKLTASAPGLAHNLWQLLENPPCSTWLIRDYGTHQQIVGRVRWPH
jgi:hypothetical protein